MFVAQPVIVETVLPRIPIEHLANREHQRRIFPFRCGKIESDFAPEIRALHAILGHADHGFLAVHRFVNRLGNVEIEPALHALLLRSDGFHDLTAQRHLIERGHALLTIEQQRLRCRLAGFRRSALDGAGLEIDRPAGVQRHERAHGERARNRGDQALDPIFVPDPTPLKIRQLDDAPMALIKQPVKVNRISLEGCPCHAQYTPAYPLATTVS